SNIWIAAMPLSFGGLRVGTRMTVVRLASGDVLLHSPVRLTLPLRAEIDAIGPVRHIVCPNLFHHLYAGEAQAAWPQARLHAPAKLKAKRKDLRIDALLSDTPDLDWQDELVPVTITGSMLAETVLYHAPSHTLITSDVIENFHSHPHWFTRGYLRLNG